MIGRWFFALCALVFLWLPASAQACAVCFGSPGSAETKALSFAIAALLAVLLVVLSCIVAFIVYLGRHSGTAELSESH